MIGHSFLHGGPLVPGISTAIVHVLMGGPIETAEIKLEDCPDLEQRRTIQLVGVISVYLLVFKKHLKLQSSYYTVHILFKL